MREKNAEASKRLGELGGQINPLILLKMRLDVLTEFLLEEYSDGEREEFELAYESTLNRALRLAIKQGEEMEAQASKLAVAEKHLIVPGS